MSGGMLLGWWSNGLSWSHRGAPGCISQVLGWRPWHMPLPGSFGWPPFGDRGGLCVIEGLCANLLLPASPLSRPWVRGGDCNGLITCCSASLILTMKFWSQLS